MKTLAILLLGCALAACAPQADTAANGSAASSAPATNVVQSAPDDAMAKWARSCALCHIRGEGGAPVVGDREAWAPRLAQGEDLLLEHTVEGLNNMPPLGYCMDCEADDYLQLIRFMGGES